jgi:hypothetical protein
VRERSGAGLTFRFRAVKDIAPLFSVPWIDVEDDNRTVIFEDLWRLEPSPRLQI